MMGIQGLVLTAAQRAGLDGLQASLEGKADKDLVAVHSDASGELVLDYNQGTIHRVEASADIELSYANLPAAGGLVIYAENWGAHTVTHQANVFFPGGVAPIFTAAGLDICLVSTIDGGVHTIFAVIQQNVRAPS